jgi:GxxExxY protein
VDINTVSGQIVDAAMRVHSALGPGLLESVYEACLGDELKNRDLFIECQLPVSINYFGKAIEAGLRLDLVVERTVVVELKSVESLLPIHSAQLLTYLKLGHYPLGLLLNFNVVHMKQGIRRLANSTLTPSASSASSVVK